MSGFLALLMLPVLSNGCFGLVWERENMSVCSLKVEKCSNARWKHQLISVLSYS
jgi:hypothetical protein